jgi:hypothetical protein
MTEKFFSYTQVKDNLPDMCDGCAEYAGDMCDECLKEYYEKLKTKEDDRTSSS